MTETQTAPLFARRYEWLLLATEATLLTGAYGAATLASDLRSALISHHMAPGLASALAGELKRATANATGAVGAGSGDA